MLPQLPLNLLTQRTSDDGKLKAAGFDSFLGRKNDKIRDDNLKGLEVGSVVEILWPMVSMRFFIV